MVLTEDDAGDAQLAKHLDEADYDGVVIGSFISGQDPQLPPTEQTTLWFNRVLNIIHAHAPSAQIILVRNPGDALPAITRVLGPAYNSPHQPRGRYPTPGLRLSGQAFVQGLGACCA